METELTLQVKSESQAAPFGMELKPNLNTGIAFDNYDRYVETLTGKNTLHDTVGIAYQDVIEPDAENEASCSNVELEPSSEVD